MTESLAALWKPRRIEQDACLHWQIGPLELWVTYANDECRVAHRWGEDSAASVADTREKPDTLAWQRFALRAPAPTVILRPRMPDRSVIVRPATPLTIMPGQDVVFFVSIPPWVRIELVDGATPPVPLLEVPVVRLSNSWFGSPVDGELCYALKTRARRGMDAQARPDRTVCPLRIRNASPAPLAVERLALNVMHLAVFQGETQLWTNLGELVHQGADALTRVTIRPGPPPYDNARAQLADMRIHPEKGLMVRAFQSLRSLNPF